MVRRKGWIALGGAVLAGVVVILLLTSGTEPPGRRSLPGGRTRPLLVGVAEDAVKNLDPTVTKQLIDVAQRTGFDALSVSVTWLHGQRAPNPADVTLLQNTARAARADGIRVFLVVWNGLSGGTPRSVRERAQFARFTAAIARDVPGIRDFVIGNEPNLNTFWMPQYGPGGRDLASANYLDLLARTYDSLKAVSAQIDVIGGGLSPVGSDDPRQARQTHSPTGFLRDLGADYRSSGRSRPIMDGLAMHPYMHAARFPPTTSHPEPDTTITIADYDKLVGLLREAFGGTPQPGASLPIYYTEFGVQTRVPPRHARGYTNLHSIFAQDAVAAPVQAEYYKEALQLAFCQPTVRGLFIFHVWDEPNLRG
ncbi:MAG: hypothetical protein WBB74_07325, partial [Gaiellaceae bacterium]